MYSRAEEEMESSDSDVQRGVGPKNFRSLLGEMKDTGSCPGVPLGRKLPSPCCYSQ